MPTRTGTSARLVIVAAVDVMGSVGKDDFYGEGRKEMIATTRGQT